MKAIGVTVVGFSLFAIVFVLSAAVIQVAYVSFIYNNVSGAPVVSVGEVENGMAFLMVATSMIGFPNWALDKFNKATKSK